MRYVAKYSIIHVKYSCMALPALKSLKPGSSAFNTALRGFKRALSLFHEAAERVPAYGDFLRKHGIRHGSIETAEEFRALPLTDKMNYMSQYDLRELSWDGSLGSAKCVSTSSGSTGVPHYWPRGHQQDAVINMMIQKIYEDVFNTSTGSTLAVDSFALGQWIAGFEFYNATKWTAERGSHIVIVTPGIDKDEAVREIEKLARYFDRIVIGGYPPFLKDIVEEGTHIGIDWATLDVRLLGGGEAVSDFWKDRMLALIDRPGEFWRYVSEFGMAEAGVVANETPLSALLRRYIKDLPKNDFFPEYENIAGLYQFYPSARYFEALPDDSLILTSDAGLPLIRYDTRDRGGIFDYVEALNEAGGEFRTQAGSAHIDVEKWQMPFLYLYGRKDFSVSLYALNIYVDHVKLSLERSRDAKKLSGLFTMTVRHDEKLDQKFEIAVELEQGIEIVDVSGTQLTSDVVATLCRVNTEYSKLYGTLGERAKPLITLVPFGGLQTIHGRKHKWFKK